MVLTIVPFVSQDKDRRIKIYENGGFNYLWNTFLEAEKAPDKDFLNLSIEALVEFVKDERIHLLFMTSEKIFETFEIFSRTLSAPGAMPPSTKAASIEIVSQLIRSAVNYLLLFFWF